MSSYWKGKLSRDMVKMLCCGNPKRLRPQQFQAEASLDCYFGRGDADSCHFLSLVSMSTVSMTIY